MVQKMELIGSDERIVLALLLYSDSNEYRFLEDDTRYIQEKIIVMETQNQYVNWSIAIVSVSLFMYLLIVQHNENVAKDNVIRIAKKIHQSL
jgi:hypothetical protein